MTPGLHAPQRQIYSIYIGEVGIFRNDIVIACIRIKNIKEEEKNITSSQIFLKCEDKSHGYIQTESLKNPQKNISKKVGASRRGAAMETLTPYAPPKTS